MYPMSSSTEPVIATLTGQDLDLSYGVALAYQSLLSRTFYFYARDLDGQDGKSGRLLGLYLEHITDRPISPEASIQTIVSLVRRGRSVLFLQGHVTVDQVTVVHGTATFHTTAL